ncbi:MAG: hypothetical protein OXC71_01785, partial [Chloroflexi bacterium]|nr:hypothetical protein [Chloroflexota bacterium]
VGIAEVRWNMPGLDDPRAAPDPCFGPRNHAVGRTTQLGRSACYQLGCAARRADDELMTRHGVREPHARHAPRAVRNNKQALYRGFNMPPEVAQEWGNALEQNLAGMQDSIEGPTAFREAPPELHRRVAGLAPRAGGGGNKTGASTQDAPVRVSMLVETGEN